VAEHPRQRRTSVIGSGRVDEGLDGVGVDQGAVEADDAAERDQVVLEAELV
jgi:hypothetical protein